MAMGYEGPEQMSTSDLLGEFTELHHCWKAWLEGLNEDMSNEERDRYAALAKEIDRRFPVYQL